MSPWQAVSRRSAKVSSTALARSLRTRLAELPERSCNNLTNCSAPSVFAASSSASVTHGYCDFLVAASSSVTSSVRLTVRSSRPSYTYPICSTSSARYESVRPWNCWIASSNNRTVRLSIGSGLAASVRQLDPLARPSRKGKWSGSNSELPSAGRRRFSCSTPQNIARKIANRRDQASHLRSRISSGTLRSCIRKVESA